jgi:DNA-binding YbaB/EbfC family protein
MSKRPGGFSGGGPQPNIQQMMRKMQEQMEAAQAEIAATEVTGSAGGGLVRATFVGSEISSISIDPEVVDPDDVETLQDLVVAAVRDAQHAANAFAEEKMGPITGGLGGALGGLGLPGI